MKRRNKLMAIGAVAVAAALVPGTAGAVDEDSIAAVAVAAGDFETLVAALTAAELVETFGDCDAGPFTVFAPTDEAFEALAAEVDLATVVADVDLLTSILSYHVVDGAVTSDVVVTVESATTLNGADISITVEGDTVRLNETVQVTAVDIEACNGVIHVIDAVLLPPDLVIGVEEAPQDLPAVGSNSALYAAIAGGLLLGGFGLVVAGRRRTS